MTTPEPNAVVELMRAHAEDLQKQLDAERKKTAELVEMVKRKDRERAEAINRMLETI